MYNYRGVYHRDLTHEVAYYAGRYTGEYYRAQSGLSSPLTLVANDHRFSSNSVKHYVCQGLIESGCRVVDNGCLPTSVASYCIRQRADGGVVVTASHNPPEHNGLKFFDATGGVLKPPVEEALIAKVLAKVADDDTIPHRLITRGYALQGPDEVISLYVGDLERAITLQQPLRVAVDCRFGTAYTIMPKLLERLGCEAALIHGQLHPYFIKANGDYLNPEPKESNIEEIRQFMRAGGYDVGLIFDGDSDRNVIVDNEGTYVTDDTVLLLLALEYADRAKPVAVTIDTALMVEHALRKEGFELLVTPVGDPFIAQALEDTDASFGGVPNGHYIFPDFNLYSDGIYSAAVMLRLIAKLKSRGSMLSEFVGSLPPAYILKTKYPFGKSRAAFHTDVAPRVRDLIARHCGDVDYCRTDDCVVTGRAGGSKMLIRYNRWDNNFNVQAESLEAAGHAQALHDSLTGLLKSLCTDAGAPAPASARE
jgi:phosphomannomutase/phosphoglucomutase